MSVDADCISHRAKGKGTNAKGQTWGRAGRMDLLAWALQGYNKTKQQRGIDMTTSKTSVLIKSVAASLLLLSLPSAAAAEPSLYGAPDDTLPAYGDYAFMRGEWQASMVAFRADGTRVPLENSAHITAFYHSDGRTFQTCFAAPNFHSTDIRAYDQAAANWRAHFLNANAQRWSGLVSQKMEGGMETLVPGGYAGNADFDVKTVIRTTSDDSFVNDVFRRAKGTDTWVQTYEMTYSRQPDNQTGPEC